MSGRVVDELVGQVEEAYGHPADGIEEEQLLLAEGLAKGWAVGSVEDLDFCLKRMGELDAMLAQNVRVLARAIARAKERTTALNAQLERGISFFRFHVEAYAATHQKELLGTGKKKSRKLLHGSIGWRQKGGGLEVADEAALLAWAKAQPDAPHLVRVKEEPALAEIKKHAALRQLVPPGMVERETFEEFEVKPSADALTRTEE